MGNGLDNLIKLIAEEAGKTEKEIRDLIDEKKAELSGLISDEGAAHIVAKELGVSLIRREEQRLNIKNIVAGMRSVSVIGRIIDVGVRNFKTEKAEGKVMNVTLADETGSIRFSLWNEEIDKLQNDNITMGDVIKVRGYVREDNLGNPELRLGQFGSVKKLEATSYKIPSVEKLKQRIEMRVKIEREKIKNLKEGDRKEIMAALVQVFETNPFYYTCPECGKTIKGDKGEYVCDEHGKVEPSSVLVISGIVDDGSENMRIVLFRENAEAVLGMTTDEARKIFDENGDKELLKRIKLGKEFLFEGRVRKNKFFDRLEFIANRVKNVNVEEEIEKLIG